jgi:hypothetical protein
MADVQATVRRTYLGDNRAERMSAAATAAAPIPAPRSRRRPAGLDRRHVDFMWPWKILDRTSERRGSDRGPALSYD